MIYAETNDFARRLCGLPPSERFPVVKPTEAELIAADLANNVDKPYQHDAHELAFQIKYQGRDV